MRPRHAITAAVALGFAIGAAQAHDFGKRAAYSGSPYNGAAIHSGAMNADDQALVDRVVAAFESDAKLKNGITATIVAKDGRISLSGSAQDAAQSARAEKLASDIAGRANVSGTLDPEGA